MSTLESDVDSQKEQPRHTFKDDDACTIDDLNIKEFVESSKRRLKGRDRKKVRGSIPGDIFEGVKIR